MVQLKKLKGKNTERSNAQFHIYVRTRYTYPGIHVPSARYAYAYVRTHNIPAA